MKRENYLVMVEKAGDMDHKEAVCDYVRRACLLVAEHIEDYLPTRSIRTARAR